MNYPIPGKLPHFSSPKTPGNGVDPDDAQIPDDQDADLDDDLDDDDEDDIDDDETTMMRRTRTTKTTRLAVMKVSTTRILGSPQLRLAATLQNFCEDRRPLETPTRYFCNSKIQRRPYIYYLLFHLQ